MVVFHFFSRREGFNDFLIAWFIAACISHIFRILFLLFVLCPFPYSSLCHITYSFIFKLKKGKNKECTAASASLILFIYLFMNLCIFNCFSHLFMFCQPNTMQHYLTCTDIYLNRGELATLFPLMYV
jgi:hypothetical protein